MVITGDPTSSYKAYEAIAAIVDGVRCWLFLLFLCFFRCSTDFVFAVHALGLGVERASSLRLSILLDVIFSMFLSSPHPNVRVSAAPCVSNLTFKRKKGEANPH